MQALKCNQALKLSSKYITAMHFPEKDSNEQVVNIIRVSWSKGIRP